MKTMTKICAAATAVAMSQYAALAGFVWAIKHADDNRPLALAR